MKVPKKRSILHKLPAAAALLLLVCTVFLTGCGKEEEGQRYAYPLATASPEDTVTQIYAEKWFFTFSSGILIKEQTCTGQQQLDYEPRRACN